MKSLLIIFSLCLLGCSSQPTQSHGPLGVYIETKSISFFNKKLLVNLPSSYEVTSNRKDFLSVSFGPEHIIEMSAHDLSDTGLDNVGPKMVNKQAEKKGLNVKNVGKNRVLMEHGGDFQKNGKISRDLHFQVGFNNYLVVITITGPAGPNKELQDFANYHLNTMLASLRPVGS